MKDLSAFYMEVGEKIRAQRGKNLSQEALASAVGLKRTSISNIEKGRQKLLLHTLVEIADALKIETVQLLPARSAPTQTVPIQALEGLRENERAFIESAIGIRQERDYGREEKKDPGNDGGASGRSEDSKGTGTGVEDRAKTRRKNRR